MQAHGLFETNNIKVKSGDYTISDSVDRKFLHTSQLDQDIALTIYCKSLGKTVLARDINEEKFLRIIRELIKTNPEGSYAFEINFIGGNNRAKCMRYINHLLKIMLHIHGDIHFNINHFAVGNQPHPNSIQTDCSTGKLLSLN